MKIVTIDFCPDSTYFTSSDVSPVVKEKQLTIYTGKGTRRSSWGAPSVTSTVVLNTATFTVVHVGFRHKHRGGQQWYYYVQGTRQTWSQLSKRRQQQVMSNIRKAPSWAKTPGKIA